MSRDARLLHLTALLSIAACIDRRSARKALEQGAESLRGRAGVRAAEAMARLGLRPLVADDALPLDAPGGHR